MKDFTEHRIEVVVEGMRAESNLVGRIFRNGYNQTINVNGGWYFSQDSSLPDSFDSYRL